MPAESKGSGRRRGRGCRGRGAGAWLSTIALVALALLPAAGCGQPLAVSGSRATKPAASPGLSESPQPSVTPDLSLVVPSAPTPIPPTPYPPTDVLPGDFPVIAYVAHGGVWTLHYEDGRLVERFLAGPVHGGEPWRLAPSPDGRALALNVWDPHADMVMFELHIVGLDGSVERLGIPDHCNETVFYTWGPDGSEVLVSAAGFFGGLLPVDGGVFRGVAPSHALGCEGAALSPDGRYVFCSSGPNPLSRIAVDGATLDKVETLVSERPVPTVTNAFDFAWSPAGDQAVLVWNRMFEFRAQGQLWLMAADGSDLRPLGPERAYDFDPAWSPDGGTIAFVRRENPIEFEPVSSPADLVSSLWLIDAESGAEERLLASEDRYAHWSPEWLPDGSGLLFLSDRGGEVDLWLLYLDGSGLQQLTRQGGLDGEIAVLP